MIWMSIYEWKSVTAVSGACRYSPEQGCEWNERSLNRERESRPRLGSDATFFGIHVRISKSMRTFEFRTISVSVSPQKFLKRSRSSSFAIETGNDIMIFVKSQELCVSVEILGHVAAIWWILPPTFPPSSPHPPSSPYPVLPGGRNSGQEAQKGPQK